MWSLKWYYLGIRSSGKALTSGGMLFTFNKRRFSDSKLRECVKEEAWLSSSPLAGSFVGRGISTHLQQLMEVGNEFGGCFSPIWCICAVSLLLKAPGDPTLRLSGSIKSFQTLCVSFFRVTYHSRLQESGLHQLHPPGSCLPSPLGATAIEKC